MTVYNAYNSLSQSINNISNTLLQMAAMKAEQQDRQFKNNLMMMQMEREKAMMQVDTLENQVSKLTGGNVPKALSDMLNREDPYNKSGTIGQRLIRFKNAGDYISNLGQLMAAQEQQKEKNELQKTKTISDIDYQKGMLDIAKDKLITQKETNALINASKVKDKERKLTREQNLFKYKDYVERYPPADNLAFWSAPINTLPDDQKNAAVEARRVREILSGGKGTDLASYFNEESTPPPPPTGGIDTQESGIQDKQIANPLLDAYLTKQFPPMKVKKSLKGAPVKSNPLISHSALNRYLTTPPPEQQKTGFSFADMVTVEDARASRGGILPRAEKKKVILPVKKDLTQAELNTLRNSLSKDKDFYPGNLNSKTGRVPRY